VATHDNAALLALSGPRKTALMILWEAADLFGAGLNRQKTGR